jgi:hypothetical protein
MMPATATAGPSRDDSGTTGLPSRDRWCAGCGQVFAPTGRQQHCSPACRKRVFRARHAQGAGGVTIEDPAKPAVDSPRRTRREYTVYECRDCATRQLGVQRCADCGRFGRAAGLGGACPGCDEPVTLADLGLRPQTTHKAQQ